jgi:hypothetical protein
MSKSCFISKNNQIKGSSVFPPSENILYTTPWSDLIQIDLGNLDPNMSNLKLFLECLPQVDLSLS